MFCKVVSLSSHSNAAKLLLCSVVYLGTWTTSEK